MHSFLLLLAMSTITYSLVEPPSPECICINPFKDVRQDFLGNKTLACIHRGLCYVSCDSECGDTIQATGFTAGRNRCVSKAACHILAEEKELFSIIGKSKSGEKKPVKTIGNKFVISGAGEVAKYQGHALGMYTYNKDTGYYVQEGGDYYLMQDRGKEWYTFPHISGCDRKNTFSCIAQYSASMKTESQDAPKDWSFGKDGEWVKDDTIKFSPLDTSSCLRCPNVTLTSTGPAMKAKPDFFGTFKKTLAFSAGRPVYKNSAGKFLMMKNEYTTFSVWSDQERRVSAGKGEDKLRGVRSVAGPTCVTDLAGSTEWQYADQDGEWQDDQTISVRCEQ